MSLSSLFKGCCDELHIEVPSAIKCSILSRVFNTLFKQFLDNFQLYNNATKNKGTSASTMLRDQLKGYAVQQQSHINNDFKLS